MPGLSRAVRLLPPLTALAFATGFGLGPSVSGRWTGSGSETLCGEPSPRPVAVSLELKQTQAAFDPALGACQALSGLIGGRRNVEGEVSEIGGYKTPSEKGPFVGCLDKGENLTGVMVRQARSAVPSLGTAASLQMPWVFEISLKADGGLFGYKRLSGTLTRPWNCPVSPGALSTQPGSDLISVTLTRQ